MTDPIIPTRIIPADQPLPPAAPPLPPAPAGSTDLPPWRTAAPAGPPGPPAPPAGWLPPFADPPPSPPPGPLEVRVTVDLVVPPPEEPPRMRWDWLWPYVRPVQTVLAGLLTLAPIPWTGYSVATTWAYTVHQARDIGIPWAYGLGLGALGLAVLQERRRRDTPGIRQLLTRAALITTLVGALGAASLYDPVTVLTGVHPR